MTTPIAVYIGSQERLSGSPIALFNLLQDIPGHCVDSTVSAQTLRANGVRVPRELVVGQLVMGICAARQIRACA
jgi:hypothetical protein